MRSQAGLSTAGKRIAGYDLARAYAIFGMFIVNFNFCFGSFQNKTLSGRFLNLFVGNSTSIFIMLAGMGLSLMAQGRGQDEKEKLKTRSIVLKRSWFLLALGLLLYNWWPGDILHFYGGYMHIAAFLLFIPERYFLWTALLAIAIYHCLLLIIPVETGWDAVTRYADFWTAAGFLRNTLYNGWNAVFPWIAYFLAGMWLGRLNWQDDKTLKRIFTAGVILFALFQGLRLIARETLFTRYWTNYIMSEYFPPYLPFMMITMGFGLMVICICVFVARRFPANAFILMLAKTGRMTLSLYVIHITLGMVIFSSLSGIPYTGYLSQSHAVAPHYILLFAVLFYALCIVFCTIWSKRFRNGPLETLMRAL
jgi:uncharacterized protein